MTNSRSALVFPALQPVAFLALAALPLSLAASPFPELSRRSAGIVILTLAGFLLVGARARRASPRARLARARLQTGLLFAFGVVCLLLRARFKSIELAGIAAIMVPPAVALALLPVPSWRSPRAAWRAAGALLATLFGALLLTSAVRGALLACAAALAAMLLALGRRGRRAFAAGALAASVGAAVLGPARVGELLIFDHKIQRLTFHSFFTGRPQIWDRALFAVGDFPLSGLGPGSPGRVIAALYPYSRFEPGTVFDDAHNLYLQVALELGVPGLLAFLALAGLAGRRLHRAFRRTRAGGLEQAWVLGLAGALAAWLIHGLVDGVAFGTPGSLVPWLLLGLIFGAVPVPEPRPAKGAGRGLATPAVRWTLAVVLVLAGALAAREVVPNRAATAAAGALFTEAGRDRPQRLQEAQAELDRIARRRCRANWLAGHVAAARGLPAGRDAAWVRLARCAPAFVKLMAAAAPDRRSLAAAVLAERGDSGEAHFWLARILARSGSERRRAVELLRDGLRLRPRDSLAWRQLGGLLWESDPQAAIEAFGESCRHGDRMAGGCTNAGFLAEHLGDLELAVRYFRKSRAPGIREHLEELEKRLAAEREQDAN